MAKEPTIITVAGAEKDEYDNLNVTDTLGNTLRVNKKHESLHSLFQQGTTIKVIWDNYKGKDFVSDAVIESAISSITPGSKPAPRKTTESPERETSIEAQVAFKGIIELLANKIIDLKEPLAQTALNYAMSKLGKWASMGEKPDEDDIALAALNASIEADAKAKPVTASELNEDLKLIVSSGKMSSIEVTKLLRELGGKGTTKLAMIESLSDGAQLHLATRIKPLAPSRLVQEAVRLGAEIEEVPF